jgi:hypothetical protein
MYNRAITMPGDLERPSNAVVSGIICVLHNPPHWRTLECFPAERVSMLTLPVIVHIAKPARLVPIIAAFNAAGSW